ncbi:hypothetical protein NDU88_006172 [Pleurodeles waltl]|uniref:Uncharacterized protein n=1 Tax=Pleurodeles waltl TaxID=8319 RepID=A0AAV7UK81_PLEWA|nr:hypothetical protein NDU88_006172 [Pleurodeles waltl]
MVTGAITPEVLHALHLGTSKVDTRLRGFDYRHFVAMAHSEGDCLGRLLAWLVHGEQQRRPLGVIKLDSGEVLNTQVEINDEFRQNYSTLYAAQPPPSPEQLEELFQALPLTHLSAAQQSELDKIIDVEEVQTGSIAAISGQQSGS